jgi:MFS family permease
MTPAPAGAPAPPDSPLRLPLFRALWIAASISNVGTWIQDVGQGWLMTSLTSSPLIISLVSTSIQVPGLILALPAGVLADLADRRRLLLATQSFMALCALLLCALTALRLVTPPVLLLFTVALGVGSALTAPAWYAAISDVVPRPLVSRAVVLNGVSWNVARAVGPALGGLLVARTGPAPAFLLNALSFLATIYVLWRWPSVPRQPLGPPERFGSAIIAGLRYARHSGDLRTIVSRGALFGLFAASALALLPLYAKSRLGGGASTYGVLLGCMGLGAVLGAVLRGRLVRLLSAPVLMSIAMVLIAGAVFGLGQARRLPHASAALTLFGLGWLLVLSCANTAAQLVLPVWVRARGLGIYLLMFSGGMAAGSALAGYLAGRFGLDVAYSVSGAGLLLGALISALLPLPDEGQERDLSAHAWSEAPRVEGVSRGPVIVMLRYPLSQEADVVEARRAVRRMASIRLRDGATDWRLYEDPDDPGVLVEVFSVSSWDEHLRQHQRGTVEDRQTFEAAKAACGASGGSAPQVIHLVAAP